MYPNYYEAEWLTRFKLKETIERSKRRYGNRLVKPQTRGKRVDARVLVPALRKSSNPC